MAVKYGSNFNEMLKVGYHDETKSNQFPWVKTLVVKLH